MFLFTLTYVSIKSSHKRNFLKRNTISSNRTTMSAIGPPATADAKIPSDFVDTDGYYLELSPNPIRFESVSQLTNVFFDDCNRQVFAVRSGGATGIVVKGPSSDSVVHSFCMEDKGPIRSIKFTADNRVLAVQRTDTEVEFIDFVPERSQPRQPLEAVTYRGGKNGQIFGFVWIGAREVAVISSGGIELLTVHMERKQIKPIKSLSMSVEWFSWSSQSNLTVLATNGGKILWPVLLRPGTITKLPKLVWKNPRGVPERDLTLAQIYGVSAILILQPTTTRLMEVVVYLLNGPGLAPQKAHLLRLGQAGRFAMNIVDDIVVVHHQATGTSMLFDIGLGGRLVDGVICHDPLTMARSIRPMVLPIPSLSFAGSTQTRSCELYSASWVLFQPDIVIDAKLGCMWYLHLQLETMCSLISDRVRLVEFLLQRTDGKAVLIDLLKRWLGSLADTGDADLLSLLGTIFDRINYVYERSRASAETSVPASSTSSIRTTLQQTCSNPKPAEPTASLFAAARVCLTQNDLFHGVFAQLENRKHIGTILLVYLAALARLAIPMQDELGRMVVRDLVQNGRLLTLRKLLESQLLLESKVMACYLLSLSGGERATQQMALDMLASLKEDNIIVEVLFGQGKIIDALRLASNAPAADALSARKYLEAAQKTEDPIIFYSVYAYFVERNIRTRGSPDFLNSELCQEYIEQYQTLFVN